MKAGYEERRINLTFLRSTPRSRNSGWIYRRQFLDDRGKWPGGVLEEDVEDRSKAR